MRLRSNTLWIWLAGAVAAVGLARGANEACLEIRLAEDKPAEGLTAVEAPGIDYPLYVHGRPIVEACHYRSASLSIHDVTGSYAVRLELTEDGFRRMREAERSAQGKRIVVLLDGDAIATSYIYGLSSRTAICDVESAEMAERLIKAVREASPCSEEDSEE